MNLKKYSFTLIILFIISCNGNEKKLNLNFTKSFTGKIDNKYPLHMELNSINGKVKGTYYYDKIGTNIKIKGTLSKDSILSLDEFDQKGKQTGFWNGKFIDKNRISGTWNNSNRNSAKDFTLILTSDNIISQNNSILTKEKTIPNNSKTIRDFTFTFLKVDEEREALEGFLLIKNNKTKKEKKVLIEIVEIKSSDINSYIKFEDFDYDGKDELLIELGEPAYMTRGFRILDYNSLEPKKVFKKTKEHIYIGNSEEKNKLTNIINVSSRSTYEINKENKSIEFGGACGASCTTIEIYAFSNNVYTLKTSKRIENGVTTIEQVENEFILDDLLIFNSQKEIEEKFGKKNIRTEVIFLGDPEPVDGELPPYSTILFPNTKNEVTFFWNNKKELKELDLISMKNKNSLWKTKEGVTIGTKLKKLEKLNNQFFTFYGFNEFLLEGSVNWKNGNLANRGLLISLIPSRQTPKELINSRSIIKSSSPIAQKANLTVGNIRLRKKKR
ncbi:hypothetical protein SHK09_11250 [Polaribacter sp. PL03]|nr:hypothetical protein [Polaribacter sp. PL03]